MSTIEPTVPRITAWGISVGPRRTERPWKLGSSPMMAPKVSPLDES